jgi:hypothetical protein
MRLVELACESGVKAVLIVPSPSIQAAGKGSAELGFDRLFKAVPAVPRKVIRSWEPRSLDARSNGKQILCVVQEERQKGGEIAQSRARTED